MAHDVFISHSSQDKPVADAVCAALEAAAIRCWIAPRDLQPGRSFAGEITRAIQHSKVMVLIFSAHTNTSEQVLREVQLAANAHLHIVQFRIQDVLPNEDLEYYLSTPHWLDALTPPLETHLGRLATSVKALLELTPEMPAQIAAASAAPPVDSTGAGIANGRQSRVPVKSTPPAQGAASPLVSPKQSKRYTTKQALWVGAAIVAVSLSGLIITLLRSALHHPSAATNATPLVSPTAGVNPTVESPRVAATTSPATVTASSAGPAGVGRNPSFAFVDMNRIFKQYGRTKDAEAKINEAKSAAKKEYDTRASVYRKALDEINNLNKQLESSSLTANARATMTKDRDDKIQNVKSMEREINEWRTNREKQLHDEALRLRTDIVSDITAKIKESGGSKDNFIVDPSGLSLNGVPFFVFAPRKADMSDRVISALNDHTTEAFLTTHAIRIAVVDMNEAFKGYNKTKDAEATVNAAKSAAKKEYDTRASAYKKALDEINSLNKQLESPGLGAKTKANMFKNRDDKIANVKKMEREINEWRTTREKQLQDQALQLRTVILKEMNDFISRQYIKDGDCMLLDISGASVNNGVWVVFWRNLPNLTNEVISGLNRGNDASATKLIPGFSDRLRFGLVDMDQALKAAPEMKQAEAEIDAAREKAKTELGAHPDAAAQAAKDKAIQSLASEKRRPIVERIRTDISAIAEVRDLDVIFDSSGKSLNGVPVIVASTEVPDVTTEVIANLGGKE